MKIISGHQPAYLPWLGLLHKLSLSDIFIYMDNVQFINKSWIHRNQILTANGPLLLTVPTEKKNYSLINQLIIFKNQKDFWQKKHWQSIKINYSKAKYFDYFYNDLYEMYQEKIWDSLSDLCWYQLNFFIKYFGLNKVKIIKMSEQNFFGQKSDLILDQCLKLSADGVVLGALGKDYINMNIFNEKKIYLYFQDFKHPNYKQLYGNFVPNITAIDLLLNHGPEKSREILFNDNINISDLKSNMKNWENYNNIENNVK